MKKKNLLCGLCITAILSGLILSNINFINTKASAEEIFIGGPADYTQSDYLLLSDGSESLNRSIQDFSSDVKDAPFGFNCSEIVQVIPRQYMESTETNAIYHYNGKEYGFFMVKEGNYFDLLLIDFVYEFDEPNHSDLEYKIKVKPILQQSFFREEDGNGGYIWIKTNDLRRTYYVANPRFLTAIRNENELNFEDLGYEKINDEGAIIIQSRVNYGNIQYATGLDLIEIMGEFAAKKALNYYVTSKTGSTVVGDIAEEFAGEVGDYLELAEDIFREGGETTVTANNEVNIFSNMSKTTQKNDSSLLGYSKVAGFMPQEEVILSDENDSYAEFITVLNDTNRRSRLTQICDYDIVCRDTNFSSMVDITSVNNGKAFSFYKERILFAEQEPNFNFSADGFEKESIPLYMLPTGEQKINFSPEYSGIYNFPLINNIELKIKSSQGVLVGNNIGSIYLKGGETYDLILKNQSDNIISEVNFTCTLQEIGSGIAVQLKNGEKYVVKYTSNSIETYKVFTDNSNCKISILNDKFQEIKNSTSNSCYYTFKEQVYYLLISNDFGAVLSINCNMELPEEYSMLVENQITLNNEEIFVRFEIEEAYSYYLEFQSDIGITYKGCSREPYQETSDTELETNWVFINSDSDQSLCFGFSGTGKVIFKLNYVLTEYQWEINGQVYPTTELDENVVFVNENKIVVRRGSEIGIRLKIGDAYFNKFEKTNIYSKYSFSNGKLIIDSDCQLTNDSSSNMLGLEAAYKVGKIARLEIQVINDIKSVAFEYYTNNTSYGFEYNAISNVQSETVKLRFQIVSPTLYPEQEVTLNVSGDSYNLTNYIENVINHTTLGDFVISIINIKIISEGGTTTIYSKNESIYQQINTISDITCNRYFKDGGGSALSPFTISCERHLRNIGNAGTNSYCRLLNNITLSSWSPISSFDGVLDLNYKTIYITNTAIAINNDYGFIATNNGTIKNGHFAPYFLSVSGENKNTHNIGVVCAVNNGMIDKVYIDNGSIYIKIWRCYLGGVAGANYGLIRDCVNYATIRGNCLNFGGIVGWNSDNSPEDPEDVATNGLKVCTNYGDIFAETDGTISACAGGIVGLASEGSYIYQPYNEGDLLFDYKNTDQRITVYMGQIAGRMCEVDTLVDPYCGGSSAVKAGVYVDTNNVSNGAVGAYFASSKNDDDSCIAAGTLVTLADGRQVPVETLTGNEMLLVWNLHTGMFDIAPILFIDHDEAAIYEIINLYFSDGTHVKVIDEHAFWDFNLNEYVFLRADAAQYVGHWFNKQTVDENGNMIWTSVQLINVTITEEYTTAWSPVTYGHLCIYVNGMLSMPGATEGLINIFEVDGDTMRIDNEQYLADIANYGLFTYEEFAELYPIPETIFEAFGGQYLKVSIGKGLIDYETLGALIERYSEFFAV